MTGSPFRVLTVFFKHVFCSSCYRKVISLLAIRPQNKVPSYIYVRSIVEDEAIFAAYRQLSKEWLKSSTV